MKRSSLFLVSFFALISFGVTGCATGLSGETVLGRTGSPMWFKSASPATQNAHFSEICRGYGFKDGTEQMSTCLQTETIGAKARAQQRVSDYETQRAIRRSKSLTCTSIGSGMSVCN